MMPRRVALDIGTVPPSVALEAATRAITRDPELEVVGVLDPSTDDRRAADQLAQAAGGAVEPVAPVLLCLPEEVTEWPQHGFGPSEVVA